MSSKQWMRLIAATAQLVLVLPLAAQRPDSVFRIEGVVVQAIRPVTTIGGSTAIQVKPDSLPLAAAASVEQLFRTLPMLHVRTNSRGEAELSVRGSESRQVAVLVDGVPITAAWDARADVSVLPAIGIAEISFVRGLSSLLHGPNVLGGVVEVGIGRTFTQPAAPSLRVEAGVDQLGGFGTAAGLTLPCNSPAAEWMVRAGASFRDSPGQPLARGITEPIRTADDDIRLNTDQRNLNGFLALRYRRAGGAWFSFAGMAFDAERGIAAELGVPNARFWRYPQVSRAVAVASAGTGDRASPLGRRGDLEISLGLDAGRTHIDAYTDRTYSRINGFEKGDGRTLTLRLLGDQDLSARGELRTAFTYSEVRHDELLPNTPEARYRQRLISLAAESNWRLAENAGPFAAVRLSFGGAYDRADTPETGGRPAQPAMDALGARIGTTAVLGGGHTLVHAGLSRRARFPALRELYSGALNRFQPNPDLRPEKLSALEAGITRRIGRGEIQAVAFYHRLEDAVVRITLPDRRFLRVNRNRLNSTGLELLGSQTFGQLGLTGDLTVQSVDLTDPQAATTNRPENLPEVFGRIAARLPLFLGLDAQAEADYTGEQFCLHPATGRDTRLAPGTHLNAHLARSWRLGSRASALLQQLEARLSVLNAGDVVRYDQCGLPQPGRLLQLQLRIF